MNDPFVNGIAERVRGVFGRQYVPEVLANILRLPDDGVAALMEPGRPVDSSTALDVVVALVREFAVDPHWLLTGHYDSGIHRQALFLGEDRSPAGGHAVREFVCDHYRKVREQASYISVPHLTTK